LSRRRVSLPSATLGIGALLVAVLAALTSVQVTAVGLDEHVYKLAAVQHYDDAPFGVLHEGTSRGAARLYSLLISPLFALFAGDVAVRVARGLNAFLFAATAVPVALLARRVVTSVWSPVAAGLLAVAVPWLTLTAVMFSESLAYLLFAITALAMTRALEAPSWKRELVVLGLIAALVFTRVQFVVMAPAWVLLVAANEIARAAAAGVRPRGWPGVVWRARTRYPVTALAIGLALLGALVVLVVGGVRRFAGPYYGIVERDVVPGSFTTGFLWETTMLSLGVGFVPAVLALVWYWRALGGTLGEDARRFGMLALVAIGLLFASTLWAQGGFLGDDSEERYYIYAIPFVWIAAAAALERRDLPAGGIVAVAAALAAGIALVPNPIQFVGEQAYLGPVSLSLVHVMPHVRDPINDVLGLADGLSGGDVLALVCVLVTIAPLVCLRRSLRARWIALLPAIALQGFFIGYGYAALHGKLDGIGGPVPGPEHADLGWLDRATPGDARVALANNQPAPMRDALQRSVVFWNDEVTDIFNVWPLHTPFPPFPVGSLPSVGVDLYSNLTLGAAPQWPLVVQGVDSPLWQIEGTRLHTSPDGALSLDRVATPPRLAWVAPGLEFDGHLTHDVDLGAAGGYRIAVDVGAPRPGTPSAARFRLGGTTRTYRSEEGEEQSLAFDLCDREGAVIGKASVVTGADLGDGRLSGAHVRRVRIERC
jgi:hypothetical protein